MQYPGVATDEGRRALECPVCKNTDLYNEGSYCIICGTEIKNLCRAAKDSSDEEPDAAGCTNVTPLPGNARFCPICGNKTTFYYKGYLRPWKEYLYTLLRMSDCG